MFFDLVGIVPSWAEHPILPQPARGCPVPFQPAPRTQWTMKRQPDWGDVYWFDFGYPVSSQRSFAGVHPALIVANRALILPGTTEIIPMSGAENKREGYQFQVPVTKAECQFLDKDSIVKVDQMYCVLTNEFPDQYFIGRMPLPIMRRIYSLLLRVLGVDKLS